MTGRDIFNVWAPSGARWVDWVRPVPFIAIDKDDFKIYEVTNFEDIHLKYLDRVLEDTAIIVDLPGNESIKEGIALAKVGFRPIPIYNGTNEQKGSMATVNNHIIEIGLIKGAKELEKINLKKDAAPAFLVDSNRMNRYKMNVSVFDNSWDIYDQDIPSPEYFLKNGIKKIIVRGDVIQSDFKKILYKFQIKGIKILFTNGFEEAKEIILKKPINKEK